MRINYWATIVRHYQLESREGDAMKEGKGNTFSTSLNKSFFYSFSLSLVLSRQRSSRVFSENRSIAIH